MSTEVKDDAYARALALANRGAFPAALFEIQQARAQNDARLNAHKDLSVNRPDAVLPQACRTGSAQST